MINLYPATGSPDIGYSIEMNCLSSSVLKIKYLDTSASVNKLNEIKRTLHKNYTTICKFGDYSLYQIGGKSQFPTFPPAEV